MLLAADSRSTVCRPDLESGVGAAVEDDEAKLLVSLPA